MLRRKKGQGLARAGAGGAVQEGVGSGKCGPERVDAEIVAARGAGPDGADRKGWGRNGGPDKNRGPAVAGKKGWA